MGVARNDVIQIAELDRPAGGPPAAAAVMIKQVVIDGREDRVRIACVASD